MSPLSKKRGHHDLRILGFGRIASTAAVRTRGDFGSIPSPLHYHYRMTEGSASRTYQPWWWDSSLKINEETENFFSKCTDYDFTQQIKSNMFYLARAEIYYIMANSKLSREEQNNKIRAVMNHPRVIRMMKDFDVSPYPIQFKLLYWSIRYRSVALRRVVGYCSSITTLLRRIH